MMELGGAEIAGIKMHAAIDVIMRRNHIHHCTMGIWCDWEAQGTRLTQNLLHDNQRPAFAKQLKGGMMCQDIFVEVGHGPTLTISFCQTPACVLLLRVLLWYIT